MIEVLTFPFMQRALIAGVVLAVVLGYLGVFVTLRRMAFFSDGLAHASLAGVAIGIITGVVPLYAALIFAVFFATIIFVLEKKTTLASDTIIGILFTSGMALGVTLMYGQGGYQPELTTFLFGNILAITSLDLTIIVVCSFVILTFFSLVQRNMLLLSLNPDFAYLAGIATNAYQLTLYILLAIAVVLGIKVVGVVLVSALLIIPVAIAKLFAKSLTSLFSWTLIAALAIVLAGIFISYTFNLPMGPAIVLVGAFTFFLLLLVRTLGRM
jgi:zinc transport system permease protein